jgi:hypothetical protein
MMKIDTSLLIQVQLAIVGILLIIGLFYIWRTVLRVEARLEKSLAKLSVTMASCKCPAPVGNARTQPESISSSSSFPFVLPPKFQEQSSSQDDDLANAQELMQQVFGGGVPNMEPSVMMFSVSVNDSDSLPASACVVEELSETEAEVEELTKKLETPVQSEGVINDGEDDDEVSISTDTNPFSKSKLALMKVEKLRALCEERDLSSEGTKTQLIERILGVSRE